MSIIMNERELRTVLNVMKIKDLKLKEKKWKKIKKRILFLADAFFTLEKINQRKKNNR